MPEILRFGPVEVRPGEREVRIGGKAVGVRGRAFDLLVALARRPNEVVSKNELLDIVWPGLVVEENNLQVQVNALRKLLGPQAIKTVPGRGYQLALAPEEQGARAAPVSAVSIDSSARIEKFAGNLPGTTPALVGRERDLRELTAQVEAQRIVTVVGAAGVGKTTLALAVAQQLRTRWSDGVWFVPLGPVNDPAQVTVAVAQALRLPIADGDPSRERLVAALEGQSLLLVLDNAEHLVDEVAALASDLFQRAPGVRLLVTSQELLNVSGEKIFKLGPLQVPPAGATAPLDSQPGALQLFCERAQMVDPAFSLNPDNIEAVAEICRRLDGLPLAIELAAARVRVLGVAGVRGHLDARFRLLTGGARTLMRRHQTLQAAFEWSHGLLSTAEQTVFRRLGVFTGGFTLELAQRVVSDESLDEWSVLDHLAALVDKSMVAVSDDAVPRYSLLETARAFALDRLAASGETPRLTERHARSLLDYVEQLHERRFGETGTLDEPGYAQGVLAEIDNVRAALAWAGGPDGDTGVHIGLIGAAAEAMMLNMSTAEALAVLEPLARGNPVAAGPERATRFWLAICVLAVDRRSDDAVLETALAHAAQGCRQLGWTRTLYRALLQLAWHRMRALRLDEARTTLAAATALEKPDWPAWLRSDRLNVESELANYGGDHRRGFELQLAISALVENLDEHRRRSRAAINAAACLNMMGAWGDAAQRLDAIVEDGRSRRHRTTYLGWAYLHLLFALLELGRYDEAQVRLQQAVPIWRADALMQHGLLIAPRLAIALGQVDVALALLRMEDPVGIHAPLAQRFKDRTASLLEAVAPGALADGSARAPFDADEVRRLCLSMVDRSIPSRPA